MKANTTPVGAVILAVGFLMFNLNPASADQVSPVKVVVKGIIVPNGTATAAMFGNESLLPTVNIVATNAGQVTRVSTALQFEFQDGAGNPVSVSKFKPSLADFTLVYNGGGGAVIKRNQTPLGAYHLAGEGSPDYFVYNGNSEVTPTGLNKFVAGYLGDDSGTLIPIMSRFVLLDQVIRLGGDPLANGFLPTLNTAGQYYSLYYRFKFDYDYNGVTYSNQVISPTATEVMILAVSDIDKPYTAEDVGQPHGLRLEVSGDLGTWTPAPVAVPHPRPTGVANILDLVSGKLPESSDMRRFCRYCRYSLTP